MLNTKTRKSEKSALLYSFALKQSRNAWKQLLPLQVIVRHKIQIIPEDEKIFPRFPSFQIYLNAKNENSEISEISLALLFFSEIVNKSMKTVATIANQIRSKFNSVLKLRKIFPRFPSFQICPNAKYENTEISEISLTLVTWSETVQRTMETVTTIASHS